MADDRHLENRYIAIFHIHRVLKNTHIFFYISQNTFTYIDIYKNAVNIQEKWKVPTI